MCPISGTPSITATIGSVLSERVLLCQVTGTASDIRMAVAGGMLSVGRQVSPMRVVLAKGSFHLCVSTFLK